MEKKECERVSAVADTVLLWPCVRSKPLYTFGRSRVRAWSARCGSRLTLQPAVLGSGSLLSPADVYTAASGVGVR